MGTYHISEAKLSNFWADTLATFCAGVLSFKDDCDIRGQLMLEMDSASSICLNLNKNIPSLKAKSISRGSQPCSNDELLKEKPTNEESHDDVQDPFQKIQQFLTETLSSFCRNMLDFHEKCAISGKICVTLDRFNAMIVEIQHCIKPQDMPINGHRDRFAENLDFSSPPPLVIAPNNSHHAHIDDSTTCPSISSKRKRKQSNPTSLSRQENNPKIIVIEPETDHCSYESETQEGTPRNVPPLISPQNGIQTSSAPYIDPSFLQLVSSHINSLAQNSLTNNVHNVPIMMQLLKNQGVAAVKPGNDSSNCDMQIPPLISKAGPFTDTANCLLATPKTTSVMAPLIMFKPATPVSSQSSSSDKKDCKTTPRSKNRPVNSLLELPDDEVHKMLTTLMSSGQTKDNCESQSCNICCPTLAYIRFRDRNRKNKSRFSMDKIEQVVNVQMYGGGTKYRDVQRMFTTYLRKLRANHNCESKCLCCEKLLLRESKKPNSNYLPHNVVPYKNPPSARLFSDQQFRMKKEKDLSESLEDKSLCESLLLNNGEELLCTTSTTVNENSA